MEQASKEYMFFFSVYPRMKVVLIRIDVRLQPTRDGKRQSINQYELRALASKIEILEHIVEICCNNKIQISSKRETFFPQLDLIFDLLVRDENYITNQELEDVDCEISRLVRVVELSLIRKSPNYFYQKSTNEAVKIIDQNIDQVAFSWTKYTVGDDDKLKKLLQELNKAVASGVGISEAEKRDIRRAMGFSQGHWYKCPNGHIYAIGDCGQAMQESKCNECGARIGGGSHRLRYDNAVATEMF